MDQLKPFQNTNRILLVIMVGTFALFGAALLYFTMEYLEALTNSASQPAAGTTIHQVGLMIVVVSALAGMPAVGFGAYVMYVGSRVRQTGQWPPAGMGFRASAPMILGSRAGLVGLAVMGAGLVVILAGLGLPIFGWQLGLVLQGAG
ncbi:MAG: hypothetical protein H6749_00560 [Nitrospiraceae bacterium]|nr:hypothetical protein [Nitrospiraceae bacterium]